MTEAVVTRFDTSLVDRLRTLATLTGRPKSYYVKQAVEEHIDELEMIYLAKQRAEEVRAGKTKTISWAKVKKQYGIQD